MWCERIMPPIHSTKYSFESCPHLRRATRMVYPHPLKYRTIAAVPLIGVHAGSISDIRSREDVDAFRNHCGDSAHNLVCVRSFSAYHYCRPFAVRPLDTIACILRKLPRKQFVACLNDHPLQRMWVACLIPVLQREGF